jgi:lipoprotein LpqH
MMRGLAVVAGGTALLIAGLTGCSSGTKAPSAPSSVATASSGSVSTSTGTAKVTIDGQVSDIKGQVVCATNGGNLTIAIGGAATGIAVVMAEDASDVTSVALGNVNGVALAFQEGVPGAAASATKQGSNYRISGTASGVDMTNPLEPVTKPFEIDVTCP